MIIKAVTRFGDLAVVLPLAAAAMLWFAYIGAKRLTFYWAASLAACMLITIILKVHFLSCPSALLDLRSPSGHASASMLVYGALGAIVAKAVGGAIRLAAIAATALLILLIAASRWFLGAHTLFEILIGLAIGGFALIPFLHAYRQTPSTRLGPKHLLVILAVLPFTLMIESPNTETLLNRAAGYLQRIAPTCGDGEAAITPDDLTQ